MLCSHYTSSNVHVTKYFLVTLHCLWWKIILKSGAEKSQRALLKTPCENPHPDIHLCTWCPNDGLTRCNWWTQTQAHPSVPSEKWSFSVKFGVILQALVSTASAPKASCTTLLWTLPFASPSPARPPASEERELCLSSFELRCLARSGETGSVSGVCLYRLLPMSFSLFQLAWISADWPRTFPLSLSWPIEIMMPTKSHRFYVSVLNFFKSLCIGGSTFIILSIRWS